MEVGGENTRRPRCKRKLSEMESQDPSRIAPSPRLPLPPKGLCESLKRATRSHAERPGYRELYRVIRNLSKQGDWNNTRVLVGRYLGAR